MHITDSVCTSSETCNSGKADKGTCLLSLSTKERGGSDIGPISVGGKGPVGSHSSGVNNPLGHLIIVLSVLANQARYNSENESTYTFMVEAL
jgi:hypothetical protein